MTHRGSPVPILDERPVERERKPRSRQVEPGPVSGLGAADERRPAAVVEARPEVRACAVPVPEDHVADLEGGHQRLDVSAHLRLAVRLAPEGEPRAEAKRELALDVAEVDEERPGKNGRAAEHGVQVNPSGRRAGEAFRASDLLTRRSDLPPCRRTAESVVQPEDDLDDRRPVARSSACRGSGPPGAAGVRQQSAPRARGARRV